MLAHYFVTIWLILQIVVTAKSNIWILHHWILLRTAWGSTARYQMINQLLLQCWRKILTRNNFSGMNAKYPIVKFLIIIYDKTRKFNEEDVIYTWKDCNIKDFNCSISENGAVLVINNTKVRMKAFPIFSLHSFF